MTINQLQRTKKYQRWIKGEVTLIHSVYDSGYDSFIVIQPNGDDSWRITRLFGRDDGRFNVSVDYENVSTEDCFKALLSRYSRGLA